jgi:putative membrane protein
MLSAAGFYLTALTLSLASIGLCALVNGDTVHRRGRSWRSLGLIVGTLALALALASPLDELADRYFSAHMVEHELFMYTIPLAWLAADPLPLLVPGFRRLPSRWRRSIGDASVRYLSLLHYVDGLRRPVAAFMLSASVLWVWHTPTLYDLALRNPLAHTLEHASFLGTAILYWQPLFNGKHRESIRLRSNGQRTLYLVAGGMQSGILGALIALKDHVIYTGYLAQHSANARVVLADQQLGGAIMWFSGAAFCCAIAALIMK